MCVATLGVIVLRVRTAGSSLYELAARGEEALLPPRPAVALRTSNAFEREHGRPIMDGLLARHMVDVALATRHELSTGEAAEWRVKDQRGVVVHECVGTVCEMQYPRTGEYVVEAGTLRFGVSAKRVRKELRLLDVAARKAYFDALQVVYSTTDEEGMVKYGETFRSISWLVREHIYGAAMRECDHWHDDAGFVNHHVGITWQLENSLVAVDSNTAAHYWDYTVDARRLDADWPTSEIFDDDWFGSANPNNTDHVVDAGRWAYTKVMTHARSYSNVTNPYGFLRSPWNTNKVPFVMRSAYVLGKQWGGFSTLPSCDKFSEALANNTWIGTTFNQLNGGFHGPVHIMIGGYWGWDRDEWGKFTEHDGFEAISFLLFAKFLWRQGYSRCPTTCSMDTAQEDCRCTCPDAIRAGRSASDILNASGAFAMGVIGEHSQRLDEFLDALCSIGFPGEMFTSAAPQDPTFWPLHGNAERFLLYARILKQRGILNYNDTWGYEHASELASDTGVVCDWSGVDGMHMPTCVHETCPGHKIDDLLPFDNLFEGQRHLFTNKEFYDDIIGPDSTVLPYAYDSLSYWGGCDGSTLAT